MSDCDSANRKEPQHRTGLTHDAHVEGEHGQGSHSSHDMTDAEKRDATMDAIRRAIRKVNAGEPQDEVCAFCGGPLLVEGAPPGGPYTQWFVSCPCGRSNGVIKGL
jgi:hypothetical protein